MTVVIIRVVQSHQLDTDLEDAEATASQIPRVIDHSSESARIILISSNNFLRNGVIEFLGTANQTEYLNTLQIAANAVD